MDAVHADWGMLGWISPAPVGRLRTDGDEGGQSKSRDPDRGGLGDPAGAGHEPGFVGGVSAWAEVMSGEGVEREAVLGWWGVAACVASAGVPARCGGPWARLGAWAPSLVCGGFAGEVFLYYDMYMFLGKTL